MYEYIEGKVSDTGLAYAVVDVGGLGYYLNTSVRAASVLKGASEAKLFLHQVVKEDDLRLYGFVEKSEREIFRLLISVSGIGANTAIVMLSSMTGGEIKSAVENEDIKLLTGIKGIGKKTAQRIIIDLKDKIGKTSAESSSGGSAYGDIMEEAVSALVMLGFSKKRAETVLKKIFSSESGIEADLAVKKALKVL
ncbi:MAG: Holliday junction branch migration protein RuvA [Bacteroidota bacterium]|nr:Holliday junction branch migration protein RuvA [Bacteroidota bacterium]